MPSEPASLDDARQRKEAQASGQLAIDEQLITEPELERLLEARADRSAELAEARREYEQADKDARVELGRLEVPKEGALRVGRFRIERKLVRGHSVSFSTSDRERVSIEVLE